MTEYRHRRSGPAVGGPLDGQRIDAGDVYEARADDGTRYLWTPLLVDGVEKTGFWKAEHLGDGFSVAMLVEGYRRPSSG